MLRSRIVPCLLIHKNGLVKTLHFRNSKYIGDPINAVKIFNEKEVDELSVFDIDKTVHGQPPNFELLKKLANESRMPINYGGGIKDIETAKKIISLGIEKVSLSSAALDNPSLCRAIGNEIGNQSVVVVLDVKKKNFSNGYKIYTHNGKKKTKYSLYEALNIFNQIPVGEIVINSIDQDGTMKGYDFDLVNQVRNTVDVPITILGGAGKLDDIKDLIHKFKVIGAGAGSLFVFKGKYRAVLINYPDKNERKHLYHNL